ncbi:hypothetical protein HYN59_11705 [Flavobacterium album]|uniref:Uncharacterized protein n=1 Tax=Flavobacterium album TaxID=2175091 RepID=A0A2S1QZP0_9FLAO|nr:hypothetical protein [Flavobacterium album]AWH85731.1 hypothetical protein HYN59_11705 [Flavobacterium album]
MANFTIDDLKLEYYWETPEDSVKGITGFPPNVILNCTQGYEVLYFLNQYMDDIGWVTKVAFNNMELLLKHRLPYGTRTHMDIKNWLDMLHKR